MWKDPLNEVENKRQILGTGRKSEQLGQLLTESRECLDWNARKAQAGILSLQIEVNRMQGPVKYRNLLNCSGWMAKGNWSKQK